MIARIARRIGRKVSSSSSYRFSQKRGQPESNSVGQRRELERLREGVKERDQRITELEEQIREQQRQIGEQQRQIGEKEKQIGEKEKQIADLERQLALRKQNSTNSSKPPSSDGLAGEPRLRGRGKRSRRKPGGQPGHRGAHRPLVPAERVDEIRHLWPAMCRRCGHRLPTQLEQAQSSGPVQRHQVTELPPIRAHITEYQCHGVVCDECGASTRAVLPAGGQRELRSPIDSADRLSDGGVSYAPAGGGSPSRAGAVHRDEFGQYSEMLGRSQSGGRRTLPGTGRAITRRSGAERGRDRLADQWR